MISRKKSSYEQISRFENDDKNRRRILTIPTLTLATSIVFSASVGTLDTRSYFRQFTDCKIDDESSIQHYEAEIRDIYDTQPPESTNIHDSSGSLTVKVVDQDESDTRNDTSLANTVTDTLSYLPSTFIAASRVTSVNIEDINSHPASGLYDYTSPNVIVLDKVTLQNSFDPTSVETPHAYDRGLIYNIAVHELGHAAVTNFCGTPIPPKKFIEANSLSDNLQRGSLNDDEYGYVSAYATTHPAEDIAETVEAMMGTPSLNGSVGVLQLGLETDNHVFLRKTAIIATMLEDLEPGAGEDALDEMRETRNTLLAER